MGLPTQENREIRSSGGGGNYSVPSTVARLYDFREPGGYLGNVGLVSIDGMANGIACAVEDSAGDARALIGDLRGTAQSLRKTSDEVHAMIAENREPLSDFTATGLTEFTGLLIEMRDLVVALNRVTTELQRDPARFFFGDRQQGYEVRQ
jgi:phospholipid/cholesterol/gamma-HCH transport system substrate-binding protein